MPHSIEIPIPDAGGVMSRIFLAGVFALYAGKDIEPPGGIGASVQVETSDQRVLFRQKLICGKHYADASQFETLRQMNGDGTSLETIDHMTFQGQRVRVDLLTLDVPRIREGTSMRFRDLGTPASFVLFDVMFEFDNEPMCPFHEKSKGVSLAELGAVVRVGDRVRFGQAMAQLEEGIRAVSDDLDEARGLALTFIAVISGAVMEMGAPREVHRLQLEAARRLLELTTANQVALIAREYALELTNAWMSRQSKSGDPLIDRALKVIDRNFAKDLSDSHLAEQLGLSTSHFRFLFKQATGQPFHKYVLAVRLERARQMLLDHDLQVSDVAAGVGFVSPAHFTRAFVKRFSVAPSALRLANR